MTQEDKQLLLVDLCARLPYWVICDIGMGKEHTLLSIHISRITEILCEFHDMEDTYQVPLANVKPYLRPMSSMTEEELNQYNEMVYIEEKRYITSDECCTIINWLNAHHFDYRGLIPKGLALSTEEFNPYV